MANRNPPPSRRRYDDKNPVISIRLTLEQYQQLRQLLERLGISTKDLFLGVLERHMPLLQGRYMTDVEIEDYATCAMETGADYHFRRGFAAARKEFEVRFLCPKCGGPVSVRGEKAIALVADVLAGSGLSHGVCPTAAKGTAGAR